MFGSSWLAGGVARVARWARRPVVPLVAVFMGVVAAAVLAISSSAQATTTYKLTLQSQGARGGISLSSTTCSAAAAKLDGETTSTRYQLAVAPPDFPTVGVTDVTIATNATSCTTLVLRGSSTVFGKAVSVLVVGTWASTTATTPTFAVAVDFTTVGLSQLLTSSSGTNVGATFTHVWLAATTASAGESLTVAAHATTGALSAIAGFFTGFQGSTVHVAGSGLSFAGDLATTGELATALTTLHVSDVQLTGTLVASLKTFSVSAPPSASLGFNVTAQFTLQLPALPGWLSFPSRAFTLSVSGDSSGGWSVKASGQATVKLPPSTTPTAFTATFTVSKAGSTAPVTVGLSVDMGQLKTAFGLSWLTLTTAGLTWTVSTTTLTAALHAKVSLGTAPSTLVLTANVALSTATGATATLSLHTTSDTLSTDHLASLLGLTLPAHTPTLTLKNLVLVLKVPKGGSVTVAAEAGATLTIGSSTTAVSVLARDEGGTSLMVAAKTTTPFKLTQLVSTLPTIAKFSLTHLAVLFSTTSVTLKSTATDTATKTFFQPLYCSAGTTCQFTVKVKSGVTIQAAVGLPTSVATMVCKLVEPTAASTTSCLSGPVTLDGHIPLFHTAGTVSLTVALPRISISSGPVQQLKLALSLSYANSAFSVSASGDMVLLVPSSTVTGTGNCPASVVTRPSTDVCLTLTVSGTLKASTAGVSVTLSASLTGQWRLPHPVNWLTIDHLALQLGITANETGPGLIFGIAGTFTVGTELGFAVHLKAMADAPFVEILGFKVQSTTGITMQDLAALYHDVSGKTLTPSALPPLALKDLLFEYAVTKDSALGLCPGLHISADLVITKGQWQQGTYTAPTSVTCSTTTPNRSTACLSNKSSCLASILLTISTQGFVGYGHLTGWSAGPLEFTPVTLDVTLTSTEVQIHISGGGKLLNPAVWATDKTTQTVWLSGSITLTVGTQHLHLAATGDIGDLTATISGTGSLSNLENPGFTLTSWFTTVKTALTTAGQHIKSAMTTVGTTVNGWYSTYVASTGNQVAADIQSAYQYFGSTGPPTWQKVYAVFQQITSAISKWNTAVNGAHMSFLDITASAIFHDALHGISVGGVTVCFIKCFTLVPGFTITGVCSYVSTLQHTPLCTSSTIVGGAQNVYANPTVTAHLQSQSLSLPTGASDKSLVTKLHGVDPPGGTTPPISCAMATESYKTKYVSPTTLQVNALGNTVTIQGPKPTTLGKSTDQTSTNKTLGQNTLNAVYSGQNQGTCTPPSAKSTVPLLSMGLKQSWIYEGGTVTAVVRAGTGITGVTLTWGDGSSTAATYTSARKVYLASHVYSDEHAANGTTSPFTVTASATVATGFTAVAPVTRRVSVVDAPLQLSTLTVTPSTIDVMQTATVSGSLLNPEAGEPVTATISWGDGTQTPVTIAPTGSFSVSHLYDRLTPTGAPQRTEPISMFVSEPDGTTAAQSSSVTVKDVAPTGLTVTPTSGAVVANRGTVFTHTGTPVGWASKVTDVSPAQRFTFAFGWNDGTTPSRSTVTAPTPATPSSQHLYTYPVKQGAVSHTFANVCLYTVRTTATDDDTLSTSLTTPVIATAPLGFTPTGAGYWLEQVKGSVPTNSGGKLSAEEVVCYLKIAKHLSPELGLLPTATSAAEILQPKLGHLTATQKLAAQLREELLTVLLDFANGSWDWTQVVGSHGATLQSVVWNANQALTSTTRRAMQTALGVLRQLVG